MMYICINSIFKYSARYARSLGGKITNNIQKMRRGYVCGDEDGTQNS
jgi:hypothetical protein